jgi:hypothetical protein
MDESSASFVQHERLWVTAEAAITGAEWRGSPHEQNYQRQASHESPSRMLLVRAESQQRLRVADFSTSGSNKPSSAESPGLSPFPTKVYNILQRHRVSHIHIEFANRASDTFPLPHSKELQQQQHQGQRDGPMPLSGPSGVSVRAEFWPFDSLYHRDPLGFDGSYNRNDSNNKYHTGPATYTTRFHALLQDLVADRILLAPVVSLDKPRLRRDVHTRSTPPFNPPATANGTRPSTVTVETILPTEVAPAAVESFQAFANLATCTALFANADAWSNFWVGAQDATTPSKRKWQLATTTPLSRRTVYWDLSANEACFVREYRGDGETSDACVYRFTHGLSYAVIGPADSSSHPTVAEIVPITRLETCPFSPLVQLDVLVHDETSLSATLVSRQTLTPDTELPHASLEALEQSRSAYRQRGFWRLIVGLDRRKGVANSGRLWMTVENDHDCAATGIVLQQIPQIIQPIWSTLTLITESYATDVAEISYLAWADLDQHSLQVLENGSLEFLFTHILPPKSSLTFSIDYNPSFLPFETFPGDANRGFELPPARVFLQSSCVSNKTTAQPFVVNTTLYGESLLLMAPLPDMSMPFNVLSLCCTLYAFVLGSILNLVTRKASEKIKYSMDPSAKPKSKLDRVREKARTTYDRIRAKCRGRRAMEEHENGAKLKNE